MSEEQRGIEPARGRRAAEVRLTDETITYLESRITAAVSKGIKGAMTEDTATAFWLAGLNALQHHATEHAGRFVLGGLWGLMRRATVFVLLGGAVYALGGWGALAALAKAMFAIKG